MHLSGWLIGGVALYFFLIDHFDWQTFLDHIAEVRSELLLLAAGAYILGLLTRAVRWTYMVRCHQPLSWIHGYHVITIANMANFLFPVRLGEVLKLVIIRKTCGVAYCSSTAATIVEKLTLFLIVMVFIGMAPLAGYGFTGWSARILPFWIGILVAGALFLFLGDKGLAWVKLLIERVLRAGGVGEGRLQVFFTNLLIKYAADTMRQCHISSYSDGLRFFWIALIGLLIIGLDGLANFLLLQSFGLPLTYFQAVIAACFFNMLFLLPSPPGQVGTAEMYPVLIYAVGLKMAASTVASAALVWHMLTMMILVVLGVISLYAVGLRVRSVLWMVPRERKSEEVMM